MTQEEYDNYQTQYNSNEKEMERLRTAERRLVDYITETENISSQFLRIPSQYEGGWSGNLYQDISSLFSDSISYDLRQIKQQLVNHKELIEKARKEYEAKQVTIMETIKRAGPVEVTK